MSAYKNLYEDCLTQLIAGGFAREREDAEKVFHKINTELCDSECDSLSAEDLLRDYGLGTDYLDLFCV